MKKLILLFLILLSIDHVNSQNFIKHFNSIAEQVSVGNTVYFFGESNKLINGLWRSDGTIKGTYLLKEFTYNPNPSNLTLYNNTLYFSAIDQVYGLELWKSDGTVDGTVLLTDINPEGSSVPTSFEVCNNLLFFLASKTGGSKDLWQTNGTKEGTKQVLSSSYIGFSQLTNVGNKLYYIKNYGPQQLWYYDSDSKTHNQVLVDDYYTIAELNNFQNSLFFITHTSYRNNIRLYKLNIDDQLVLLKEWSGDLDIDNFVEVNNSIFFSIRKDFENAQEKDALWITNGTPGGTKEVKSFNWDYHSSNSYMGDYIAYKDELYFRSGTNYSNTLWKSDGTTSGTVKVSDVNLDREMGRITISKGLMYFTGQRNTYASSCELWYSDGTTDNTAPYAIINMDKGSKPNNLFDVNGKLFFTADDGSGRGLWTNDYKPEINIKYEWKTILSDATIKLNTQKVDFATSLELIVKNDGKKDLIQSLITSSGGEFFINNRKNKIAPNDADTIKVTILPKKEGLIKGKIVILNNDPNEHEFIINLEGVVEGILDSPVFLNDSILLNTRINGSVIENNQFRLNNNSIQENATPNSLIGHFECVEGDVTDWDIHLINGDGDDDNDNDNFWVSGNELLLKSELDYETKNTYTIRLQFAKQNENVVHEHNFVVLVENINEFTIPNSCNKVTVNMSYALNDIEFVDDKRCYAIGNSGVILYSIDAGESWEKINSGTLSDLQKLQFVTQDIGYIVGGYGDVLLKTEDGGMHWFPLDVQNPDFPYISNLYFINKDLGFVIGGDGKVFKTVDGGKNWDYKQFGYNDITSIYFTDETTGYLCGRSNSYYKTIDGGDTWTAQELDDLGWNIWFKDIVFISDEIGYLLGDDGQVFKTSNSGATWSEISRVPTDYAQKLCFVNDKVGYIVGGWSGGCIYKTLDSGITWSANKLSATGVRPSITSIAFNPSATIGITVGDASGYGSTAESGHAIISSCDGGENWNVKSYLNGSDDFRDVYFNGGTGYITSSNSYSDAKIYKTIDNGITWKLLDFSPEYLSNLYFANENHIITISDSIYVTQDGGINWEGKVSPEGSNIYAYIDEHTIYRLKNNNYIGNDLFRSDDFGSTWQFVSSTDKQAYYMFFKDEHNGFLLGYNLIQQTHDGGLTWDEISVNLKEIFRTGCYIDANTIILGGTDGALVKTMDGGANWDVIKTQIGSDILKIFFTSNTEGYILTSYGLYKTNNTGVTWILTSTSSSYTNAYISTNNDIYVLGKRGEFNIVESAIKPSQASYIKGPKDVCVGEISDYQTISVPFAQLEWSINNDNSIFFDDLKAIVKWSQTGKHTIVITPKNGCGDGKPQYFDVNVHEMPNILLAGKDTVSREEKGVIYSLENNLGGRYHWHINGSQSSSALDANRISVDWSNESSYSVEVIKTSEDGCRTKEIKHISIKENVSEGQEKDSIVVQVFPNPAHDYINIEIDPSSLNEAYSASLVSINGELILRKSLISRNTSFSVSNIPNGIYLLNITDGKANKEFKIVIKTNR